MRLSVILSTHHPDLGRLAATLAGVRAQTLAPSDFELLLIDNASPAESATALRALVEKEALENARVILEERLGLTRARQCGIQHARGEFLVLLDDDNVLAPDYLATVCAFFSQHPEVGAVGGKVHPRFEVPPEPWTHEFLPLLALRDLGEATIFSQEWGAEGCRDYPMFAPFGAGMALRTVAARHWAQSVEASTARLAMDRQGDRLISGGDNDIVLTLLGEGWRVAYFPALNLQHLIPPGRLTRAYFERLNRALQRSWVEVLALHRAAPWQAIPAWTLRPRQLRAYLREQAWRDAARAVRWQGVCGHFEGRVAIGHHAHTVSGAVGKP